MGFVRLQLFRLVDYPIRSHEVHVALPVHVDLYSTIELTGIPLDGVGSELPQESDCMKNHSEQRLRGDFELVESMVAPAPEADTVFQ
jgi:hypothetical protein